MGREWEREGERGRELEIDGERGRVGGSGMERCEGVGRKGLIVIGR